MSADPGHSQEQQGSYRYAYLAWLLATVATLGSLFFGEVMKLPPCTLCWYQRICLFPLTAILATGIILRDSRLPRYALPLVLVGLGFAVYHNLLYYGVIPETLSPCTQGVSCRTVQIEWLDFITIPLMALVGFLGILGSLILHARTQGSSGA
ncbi:MAG: disulfide bond formation protein B [Deltaproteobacteria bacterium]|jgi:disulfide bond formation protein DsbB|nr:disulfide bond formation protein B [Deltaproteobacteria bacterium]